MASTKFTGYAWHIEKKKGFYPNKKSCFNCVNFCDDDNSCAKKSIKVTNNNAWYCTSFDNKYKNDKNDKVVKDEIDYTQKINEFNNILKNAGKKEITFLEKSIVEDRDVIWIRNDAMNLTYMVKILDGILGEEEAIRNICINKKVGFTFEYKNNKFRILKIKKRAISIAEQNARKIRNENGDLKIKDQNIILKLRKEKVNVKKKKRPIAEKGDKLYFATREAKKGSKYRKDIIKVKDEIEYKELIKRCIGEKVGYNCKFNGEMYKLIRVEKNKKED